MTQRPLLMRSTMRALVTLTVLALVLIDPPRLFSQDASGGRPLLTSDDQWQSVLPSDSHPLIEIFAIEQFLETLDGVPPDWRLVYGHGHHDPGLDGRLFQLNRDRDAKREGNPALGWRVTFLWPGELSDYDPETGGFRVAVGPKLIQTRWGIVRFKPEDMPANLRAIPDSASRQLLQRRIEQGHHVEINVALTGTLIPGESFIYDFSHDEEGRGVIMPVVRVEQIAFVLLR
jgi:hypothetical protein